MKEKKIVTTGNQLFNVPNTEEGLEFLKLAGKFLNKKVYKRLRKRGRGKNRPTNMFINDMPVKNAEWFAVYGEDSRTKIREYWDKQTRSEEARKMQVRKQIARELLEIVPEIKELI